jgi:aspartyl-tRNA(Asn)/glutamyl-tRNA(Gln) amidotransferase subunit A
MPPSIASANADPTSEITLIRNTVPFNALGIPTISIPCGFSRAGLPIGLQISGPRLGEVRVLALAHAYEQATEWHRRTPAVA